MRGQSIAQNFGWVRRVDETRYAVHSQRLDKEYQVEQTETGWVFNCPDSTYRMLKCKHVWAVEISWTLRKKVEEARRIEPIEGKACVACGSANLMKWGVRHNKSGDIQRFSCRDCKRLFVVNIGFERMKHNPQGDHYRPSALLLGREPPEDQGVAQTHGRSGLPADRPQLDNQVCRPDGEIR
jgi:putative transposase